METASIAFKKYQAQRVVDLRSMPRVPPFLFVLVLPFDHLGWVLRKAGVLAPESKILAPFGWSARPGFRWEIPKYAGELTGIETGEYKPNEKSVDEACAAFQAAREVSHAFCDSAAA